MSDRNGSRIIGDDDLGRQLKANLSDMDSFIPPAPPFEEIESPAMRPVELRRRSAGRPRLKLSPTPGLVVAGLLVVVVLGSGVWRPSHAAEVGESPAASGISANESVTIVAIESGSPVASSFRPTPRAIAIASIAFPAVGPEATSPWYAVEVYMLNLMNCTRTGGWVTTEGACISETDHTLPAQPALVLDPGISDRVARPYAKYLADNALLDHYLNGTTPRSRLCSAGWCGSSWGENLASPGDSGPTGVIAVEIFYQNESFCMCEHYHNIMDPHFGRVGIGVWESSGHVRVVIDFSE